VLALTPAQVAELRKRLNVVVEEDAAGKSVTVAPVESFDDMVCFFFRLDCPQVHPIALCLHCLLCAQLALALVAAKVLQPCVHYRTCTPT
jgi:hypothetical protein